MKIRGNFHLFQLHALLTATVTNSAFAERVFDEDAAHGFGGGREEMGTAIPLHRLLSDELQPSLVDQGGVRLRSDLELDAFGHLALDCETADPVACAGPSQRRRFDLATGQLGRRDVFPGFFRLRVARASTWGCLGECPG